VSFAAIESRRRRSEFGLGGSIVAEGRPTVLGRQELVARILAALDDAERDGAVAYYREEPLAAGEPLGVPKLDTTAPFDAFLGFVDREPAANWSHGCRYLLIDRETGKEVVSIEAQLPPFTPADEHRRWRVAYKAPSVPDAAVAVSS
jgi:hypothetical protein